MVTTACSVYKQRKYQSSSFLAPLERNSLWIIIFNHYRKQNINIEPWPCACTKFSHRRALFPLNEMVAVSQTISSNVFSLMKNRVFLIQLHWSLFLRVQLTEKIGPGNNLAPNRRQAITWTNANSVHIYEVLERDDLKKMLLKWKMESILSSARCVDIMLFFSLSLMYVVI